MPQETTHIIAFLFAVVNKRCLETLTIHLAWKKGKVVFILKAAKIQHCKDNDYSASSQPSS